MTLQLHRILIAGCALLAGLHGPRAIALLCGVETPAVRPTVQAAEAHPVRDASALATTRVRLLQGQARGGPFTALIGRLSATSGS